MGQSLVKNYVHIVFSTKHRKAFISASVEGELHSYLAGICKALDCQPIKIGGYTDHVHILCMLSKKTTLVKLLGELKSHSSLWMKTKDDSLRDFYWQDGYGAFSVSPCAVDVVSKYIEGQHDHHSGKSFQQELREIFAKHKMEYDERYVWE